MNIFLGKIRRLHDRVFGLMAYLQSPFLFFIRLYWGWQLAQSGWGKLHNLGKVTEFFASLNLPAPGQTALFIACVEFFGGIFFAAGAFSRVTSLVLTVNLTMAYVLADREASFSIFSAPDKFQAAAPFNFLFAALVILVLGAGKLSVDGVVNYALERNENEEIEGTVTA